MDNLAPTLNYSPNEVVTPSFLEMPFNANVLSNGEGIWMYRDKVHWNSQDKNSSGSWIGREENRSPRTENDTLNGPLAWVVRIFIWQLSTTTVTLLILDRCRIGFIGLCELSCMFWSRTFFIRQREKGHRVCEVPFLDRFCALFSKMMAIIQKQN